MPSYSRRPRTKNGRTNAEGFTLLELLVVLVILGLLAAIATPQVMKYLGKAKIDATVVQIQNLTSILELYRLDTNQYPTQEQGLDALIKRPTEAGGWNGPYVKKSEALIDPWGQKYLYKRPGEHGDYDLYSLGGDRTPGGSGEDRDVTNW